MDAGEIAEDRDAGNIFAMKRENTRGLRAEVVGAIGRRDVPMDVFMMLIIGRSNLR